MTFIIKILFSIFHIILWIVETIFFYKLLTNFVSPKNNRILQLLSIASSFFLVNIMIFPEDMINILGAFILFLLIMIFCFNDSLIQRTSVVLTLLPLIIAINFLTEDLGMQTYIALGGTLAQDMTNVVFDASNNSLMDSCVHLFYNLLETSFWFLLYKTLEKRLPNVKKLLTESMWKIVSIICLAPLSGIISIIYFAPKSIMLIYPAVISSIITIVGILLLTGYIANTVIIEMDNKNLLFQQAYYDELESNQRETAKLRHDMNNHLGIIGTFIENGSTEEAKSYYNNLLNKMPTNTCVFCKNSIVNAVINAKYHKAGEEQIDCFFNIDLGSILSIDDISLCSIFANTLDNAIEACSFIPDISKRSISLKARYADGYFSYSGFRSKM